VDYRIEPLRDLQLFVAIVRIGYQPAPHRFPSKFPRH
jgi:hypothetical protein